MSYYHDRVPPEVSSFLVEFADSVASGDLKLILEHYHDRWEQISKNNYRTTSWPTARAVQKVLKLEGEFRNLFLALYKQLYYRHIFRRIEPGEEEDPHRDPHRFVDDYIESFSNFTNLFNLFVKIWRGSTEIAVFELPNLWLWDIIHSFVSQCQNFHLWKATLDGEKTELSSELQRKIKETECWNPVAVFRYLTLFTWFAGIPVRLSPSHRTQADNEMQSILGQFSVIGMLRLHTLLGDYTTALETLENIELRTNNIATAIWDCDLTISYHMAVCYLMKGRFADALSIVPEVQAKYGILLEGAVSDTTHHRISGWYNKIKKMEGICKFMCWNPEIAAVFQDEAESIENVVMRKWIECCPEYISPKPPSFNGGSNRNYVQEAQERAFELLVKPRFELDNVRSSLTVYRSVDLPTLGNDISENNYLTQLIKFKLATRQIQKGADDLPHEGSWGCCCDSDFFIKDNFLETREIESDHSYAEELSKLILNVTRFEATIRQP